MAAPHTWACSVCGGPTTYSYSANATYSRRVERVLGKTFPEMRSDNLCHPCLAEFHQLIALVLWVMATRDRWRRG